MSAPLSPSPPPGVKINVNLTDTVTDSGQTDYSGCIEAAETLEEINAC